MALATPESTPQTIGKYRVLCHLKSGGMAAVYKAEDPANRRIVALKVLTTEPANQAKRTERFRREARQGARLRHDNLVTLYEFGETDGILYLALEYIDGIDVEELIQQDGALAPEDARAIVIQVARALDYAHGMGVVHRDIKPSNILITRRHGRCIAKLGDLGLARGGLEEESRVTSDGSTVGTVDYMPPEQARNSGSADARSDIYSLGCSLYHMLAGAPPFAEGSIIDKIKCHAAAEPTDLREMNPQVPENLWAICRRMLAKKPSQRYQTAAELLADLAHAAPAAPAAPSATAARDTKLAATTKVDRKPAPVPTLAERMKHQQRNASTSSSGEGRRIVLGQFEHGTHAVAIGNYDYGMMLLLNCCRLEPGNLMFHQALHHAQFARHGAPGIHRWRSWPMQLLLKLRLKWAQRRHQPLRVLEFARELLICNPKDLDTQIAMAEAAQEAGFGSLAAWLLETALATHPDDAALKRVLAEVFQQQGEVPRALELWETIAQEDPSDCEASKKVRDLAALIATGKVYVGRNARKAKPMQF